jgi:hypothetical protein
MENLQEDYQAKYPKFYANPYLWIDTSIQLQCIEKHLELKDDLRSEISLGALYLYDAEMYNTLYVFGTTDKYKPLFKPETGEQFIKDLESAVSAAMNEPATLLNDGDAVKLFTGGLWYVSILMENIGIVNVRSYRYDLLRFDTAAYVDTMRRLGYYL